MFRCEEIIHGPSATAERQQVRKSKVNLDRGREFLKFQKQKLELQSLPKEVISETFKNVCVYFGGYTDKLSALHLKKLVQAHSGQVSNYYSPKKVTHVVTTTMSFSKTLDFLDRLDNQSVSKKIYVVHPDWIIHSCNARTLFNEFNYLICKNRNNDITQYMEKKETNITKNITENQQETPKTPGQTPHPHTTATEYPKYHLLNTSPFYSSIINKDNFIDLTQEEDDQPGSNTSIPLLSPHQPGSNDSIPLLSPDQPGSNTSIPLLSPHQSGSNTSIPLLSPDQPGSNTSIPLPSPHQPGSNTSIPLSLHQPGSNTSIPLPDQLGSNASIPSYENSNETGNKGGCTPIHNKLIKKPEHQKRNVPVEKVKHLLKTFSFVKNQKKNDLGEVPKAQSKPSRQRK